MRKIFLKTLLPAVLCTIWVQGMKAQSSLPAYTYVQQNGEVVKDDGCAAFDVNSKDITMEFDADGNGIMYYTDAPSVTIAKLPIAADYNGGELCGDFSNESGLTAGSVSKTIKTDEGYATICSPFLLSVSGARVYTGQYDSENKKLSITEISGIIPIGTGLVLKGTKDNSVKLNISSEAATADVTGNSLSGTTLPISVEARSIYTLGYSGSMLGFCKYTKTSLSAATAYLSKTVVGSALDFVPFDFEEETIIENVDANVETNHDGKFLINGKIVIIKNGRKYNINGQEVK